MFEVLCYWKTVIFLLCSGRFYIGSFSISEIGVLGLLNFLLWYWRLHSLICLSFTFSFVFLLLRIYGCYFFLYSSATIFLDHSVVLGGMGFRC